ncbi:D-2-hydroxyacid dehydrogenase [Peribacillus huizhouensis]|uniref:Phosphoglycerate dehydrogenase-like enzyme n=1 Tax=Peribacillus huizhouensis TaxID=1501239 RepID=A0ABR6CPS3_9BACI|nr:D-2-hydroxyacid dehydrogenase [Peribacillus huizhouensis]MBA9027037.1 phosphoglycerate dehydrogenase-like enzyme [Peribacillus huizhouensis]
MSKRTLIINTDLENQFIEKIKVVIPDWNILIGKDPQIWQDQLTEAEIIVIRKNEIMDTILSDQSKLKWLQSWSAGVNTFPLKQLEEKEVIVTSANGVHAYPISETIFSLMLGLTRKLHTYVKQQQSKIWDEADVSLEIHKKTIGIIGVGAIGLETAKIAKAFGMKVLGVRHSGKTEEYVDTMYRIEHLNEVLPQCDYVVVTLPLTNETKYLFGTEQFKNMKKSAFFINIARGQIVREDEMITALKLKEIAGAGLDVFTVEPLPENSPLWNLENVIITPHSSGITEYYDQRVIEDIFIPNLKSYVDNKTPTINIVDYRKGY